MDVEIEYFSKVYRGQTLIEGTCLFHIMGPELGHIPNHLGLIPVAVPFPLRDVLDCMYLHLVVLMLHAL